MIHTNRTVTVGNQESIIDSPIILYRGDREVEVEFTLNGNKFTFTNEGNVIKSTNAVHGQLVINTPSGENMFSEVTDCHEGKVVFVITKEMIDELIEIGFYSFQIRLFDESQVSRVTIPPVHQGIDIRNPIAAEDETNIVDIGLVDYAIVQKDEFEDLSTFLPSGDYNKTDWESRDVISAAKLNKIEDALYLINDTMEGSDLVLFNRIDNLTQTMNTNINNLNTNLTNRMDNVNSTLSNEIKMLDTDINTTNGTIRNLESKVDNNYNSLNSNKVSKSELGAKIWSMSNMGQDVKAAMTGGSVAVVGPHAVSTENILPNQVTHDKLANNVLKFKETNMIGHIFDGRFINWNDGGLNDNQTYIHSDYISVAGYDKVYARMNFHYALYDAEKKFISGHQGNPAGGVIISEIAIPEGAAFLRVSTLVAAKQHFVVGLTEEFVTSGYTTMIIPKQTPDGLPVVLENDFIETKQIVDGAVTREKTDNSIVKCEMGINKFSIAETGKFVDWNSGGEGTGNYNLSHYIPIKEGDVINQSSKAHYAMYNSKYARIEGHRNTEYTMDPLVAPAGAAFIRVSPASNDVKYMLTVNEPIPETYIPPSYALSPVNGLDIIIPIPESSVGTSQLMNNSVTREKLAETVMTCSLGKNRFSIAYPDQCVNWNGDTLMANTLYNTSSYIPIKEGDVIYQSTKAHYAIYDINSKCIEGHRDTEYTIDPLVAPAGAAFIRVSPHDDFIDTYMLTINEEATSYEPAQYTIDDINGLPVTIKGLNNNAVEYDKIKASRLYGKKVSWYGTSITQGYGWCQLVNKVFGFNATNNGVGGTAICKESVNSSMCTINRMQGLYNDVVDENTGETTLTGTPIPTDVEIIFIEGGTNDWARNWPIGNETFTENFDDQTFAGACHLMFKNMTQLFPNAEIIIVGSPFGKMANRAAFTDKYGVLNNQGLQTVEYGDVLLDIAGKWGIKGFNMGRVMQIHDNNIAEFIPDGLHLSTDAVKQKAADAIVAYLLTL